MSQDPADVVEEVPLEVLLAAAAAAAADNRSSSEQAVPQVPKGAATLWSEVPVKDWVIVLFMLGLWLYSIMLIVRAWAKVHHMPGGKRPF